MEIDDALLSLDLNVDYPNMPQTLRNVSLSIRRGEVLGLVGESGSGKSTIALAILKLLGWKEGKASGSILFRGRDLMKASEREMPQIRGRNIGLVPLAGLNPALRIGTQLKQAWKAHAKGTASDLSAAVVRALVRVGSPQDWEFAAATHRQPVWERRSGC